MHPRGGGNRGHTLDVSTKVLHILQYSLPSLVGYTVRTDGLLRGQLAHGIDAVALTGTLQPSETGAEEIIKGVRYLRTRSGTEEHRHGLRQWKIFRSFTRRIGAAIRDERPDLLHVHSPAYNGLAALVVGKRRRLPVVYELRGLWEDAAVDQAKIKAGSLYYNLGRGLETFVLRRAAAVVTICNGLSEEIVARGVPRERVFVAGNGVDTDSFQPAVRDAAMAESLGLKETDGPVFGFIGSLFRYEGIEEFLDAIPPVRSRYPNARFLIVGGGEREQQVRERAAALCDGVKYLPKVPHSEVHKLYSVCDCLVYPRRKNRITDLVTPLKPLEAMAMRKAVVASDVGGHRELIQHERTGLLYRADDARDFVETLCRAASDRDELLRLADQGREFVLTQRNWRKTAEAYLDAYALVLGRPVSTPIPAAEALGD